MATRPRWFGILVLICIFVVIGVAANRYSSTTTAVTGPHLIVYDWPDDIPQAVLDGFTTEFGVPVVYQTYDSADAVPASLRAGGVYDVVVMEHRFVRPLVQEGLLAKLPRSAIPNYEYVSPDFRNLAFDPNNDYTIPFSWGSTGIIVRQGLVDSPSIGWGVLWEPQFAGHIGVWRGQMRDVMGATLKQLGYSANTENPAELAAARDRLLALRPNVQILDDWRYQTYLAPILMGQLTIGLGDVDDAKAIRALTVPIDYLLPTDGAMLWRDNLAIPSSSTQPELAASLINYMLRPEVSALFLKQGMYRVTNTAADQYADPSVLADKELYPPIEILRNAELLMPLSPEGDQMYQQIWSEFLAPPDPSKPPDPGR